MTFTKLDQADLSSPCRELSIGGLGIVVALSVRWCVRLLGSNPAVTIALNLRATEHLHKTQTPFLFGSGALSFCFAPRPNRQPTSTEVQKRP